jgi:hypothetical protein
MYTWRRAAMVRRAIRRHVLMLTVEVIFGRYPSDSGTTPAGRRRIMLVMAVSLGACAGVKCGMLIGVNGGPGIKGLLIVDWRARCR